MFRLDDSWVFSASDLVGQMECDHRTRLTLATKLGLLTVEQAEPDGMLVLAAGHGEAHENRMLEQLKADGLDVVEIPSPSVHDRSAVEAARDATVEAMRRGAAVVYQALFFDGEFFGKADFVRKVGGDAEAGWHYEVWDTKLARSAKPGALLQLAAYSEQVAKAGFGSPTQMHVWLGSGEESHHDVDDVMPTLVKVRDDLRGLLAHAAEVPTPLWGEARTACGHCSFAAFCAEGREEARDLSLVANIRGNQRRALMDAGVTTVEDLAALGADDRPKGIAAPVFERLVAQARLQAAQHASRSPEHPDGVVSFEVFDHAGLVALPPASPGDVWFDMEGDPFAEQSRGLEYLFGAVTADGGDPVFHDYWAHTVTEEKEAFEAFVDFVEARRRTWPGLHVYHYAPYERTALRRLSGDHGTREAEIDEWLRVGLLVDLYATVRTSIRISQGSYSIKKLEPLYGRVREEDVKTAGDSVVDYEHYLELTVSGDQAGAQAKLDGIRAYNEVDCLSTRELDRWLRDRAADCGIEPGAPATELREREGAPRSDDESDRELLGLLLADVPPDRAARSPEQQAAAMLAASLAYHRREAKPGWWEHFDKLDAPLADLADDADVLVVGEAEAGPWDPKVSRARRRLIVRLGSEVDYLAKAGDAVRLAYDAPPEGIPTGSEGGRGWTDGKVLARDERTVTCEESVPIEARHGLGIPVAVLPGNAISTEPIVARLRAIAEQTVTAPSWPHGPAHDLLARTVPRLEGTAPLPRTGDDIADGTAAVRRLDGSYLAVQGPPGTGKTYLGARVVAALVRDGWRVGVVAQSHAVVEHFLDSVIAAGLPASRVAKEDKHGTGGAWARASKDINGLLEGSECGVLVGGTAWTFCRKAARAEGLDLLVIDEAGQFALAHTIAVAAAARNLLLLGDPAQLPQVSQGTHPEPVDQAALGWIAGGDQVLPEPFGYFLATSWRMHPEVCETVSRLAYRGRLGSHPRTAQRSLHGIPPGVRGVPVDHRDRTVESPEEVAVVVDIVQDALGRAWHDEDGDRALGEADLLVVSPYNRQVNAIRDALDAVGLRSVRVGTVDKFQGQEAPVVVVSMASSSHDDVPRGLEFLLSRNRLNVAVSRAKWAALVVHSPSLAETSPGTVEQLRLVSGFLRIINGA